MSDMEAHIGQLVPMVLLGDTLEERAKDACTQLDITATGAHESFVACLRDRGHGKVYIRNNVIYQIQDKELDASGFSIADKEADGSIVYCMLYYNGGASFDEVLDAAIEKTNES